MSRSKNTKADMKFKRIMHEFSQNKLTSNKRKVTDKKQALAIAFKEARKVKPTYSMKEAGVVGNDIAVKGSFSLDSIEGKTFPGYTFGEDWNGWATPYFEIDQATEIAKALGGKKAYDKKPYFMFPEHGENEGTFSDLTDGPYLQETIKTEDGEKVVYPIGAYNWTWENSLMNNGGEVPIKKTKYKLHFDKLPFILIEAKSEKDADEIYRTMTSEKAKKMGINSELYEGIDPDRIERIQISDETGTNLEKIYATGTSKQLWDQGWDEKKRSHFLIDHADMYMEEMGKKFNLSVEKFSKMKYSELPNTIKKQIVIHHAMGIYKEGGIIKPGTKLSPENKKIKLRIDTLKSSFSGIKSEKAKKKIQDKIDKLQKQFEYRPSTKEKIESNKGKFAMDVPTEYGKSIYKKLWTMHVFPKVHKLNGTSSIVVNSRNNLAKAYKVYSDILKEKKEEAPTLSKISRKL